MLRKIIRDGSPRSLGLYKDVSSRAVTGVVVKAAHGNNCSAACLILEWQGRSADGAKSVREAFGVRWLERSQVLLARGVAKRFERYEQIRSKRRSGCLATAGAVAIVRPGGRLCQLVSNRPAQAAAFKGHITLLAAGHS